MPAIGNIAVKLHDNQLKVVEDTHRFKVVNAGRRWGKSVLSRMTVLSWAAQQPGGLFWIVSPTFQMGKDIHWFQGFRLEIPKLYIKRINEADLTIDLVNNSRIQLKSAENPDRLKGIKLNGLVVDEIATMRNWDWIWQEALRPTLSDFQAPALFISTPRGYNFFYDLYLQEQKDSSFKSFHFTTYDNPKIPVDEIESARLTLNQDYFAQEYMAEFKTYTGLVYKVFDRHKHVHEMPKFEPIYYLRGLDKGFRNPTACILIAVDKNDIWYAMDEIYETGLTNPPLAELLKQQRGDLQIEYSTMDSAHASDIQDLADLGEDFLPVSKQPKDNFESYVTFKIQKLTERIKQGKLIIDPACENLIKELERYRWKEKRDDLNQPETPEKANDHLLDALADLNAMYIYDYTPQKEKKVERLPGTHSPVEEVPDEASFYDEINISSF
jgi:phage terminase large subunit